jgi:hypothetical protein
LPSLQAAPSVLAGFEHAPVPGSQVPALWHWSLAVHTTGFAPVHAPDWQVSARVQTFPSLHTFPSGARGVLQAPVAGSQTPTSWH